MNSVDQFAKTLNKIIDDRDSKKPTPKDDRVTVTKVEGDTVWVHFPGGVDETPVQRTLDAKVGDTVTVRRAEGKAWITGNNSSPPTDDSTANYAVDLSTNVKKDVTVLNTVVTENIEATNARFGYVEADTAKIHDLTADQLTASVGYIEDLTSEHITVEDLVADHATVDTLDAHYAQIDIANVNNAWIENGTIKKAEVFDENVFDLSGNRATLSRLDASKINVANLRADNLVVRRINGQPVVGGYTLIDSNSPGYSSKNPQALGWYEFVNADWVLSTDTTVDMTKAYYQEGNEVSLYDQAYIDGLESDLQQQIDGAVETYTGSVVPTLTNWPYTDWYDTSVTPIHDERAKHVGDIYYVVNSSSPQGGYCYRFAYDNTTHAYSWVLIKDSDITKALSDISELQTFESETTSWIEETDEGLETIRTNYTNLSGRVDDVEDTANAALPATTFETFESTTFTDLVDEVDEQSTTMTNMTTRLGLNADGTQSATDIVSKESALEQTVNGISTRVGKTEAHLIGMYATSSTAEGTAAKVATITPAIPSGTNWELSTGTTVTVKFTNANTAASPTLNVNSKGAKPIKTYANGNLSEAEYKWKAGSTFTFTYNGTNWLMQDSTASVRMSSAETSITQNADAIKLEAVSREMAVNLLLDSDAPDLNKINAPANRYWSNGGNTWITCSNFELTDAPEQGLKYGRRFVCDGTYASNSTRGIGFYNSTTNDIPYAPNTTYTATWWARCTSGAGETRVLYPNGGTTNSPSSRTSLNSSWKKCVITFTTASALNTNYNRLWFEAYFVGNTVGTVEICGCKLVAGDAVEQYKTTIEQTSNNVLIKATRDGATDAEKSAGGTSAIGLINVSPDNVKIAAENVDIIGTTIFSDGTSINSIAQNAADSVKVGGRNLILNTSKQYISPASASGSAYVQPAPMISDYGISILNNTTDYFTYSFDYSVTGNTADGAYIYVQIKGTTFTPSAQNVYVKNAPTGRASIINRLNATQVESTSVSAGIRLRDASDGAILTVSNIKLEKGNKATDWTPAPEDVQAEIDAKKSVHTLDTAYSYTYTNILTYSAEGYGGTSGASWTVSSTVGVKVGDTARLKVTVSDMSNAPVYVIGTVTGITSETALKMTSHGLDTTIIDGGNILTNSIGANQIIANSITAKELAVRDFNNYITVTEKDETSLINAAVISDGWIYKNNDGGNIWLSPVIANWTSTGEQYRLTGTVKAPAAGRFSVTIAGRDASGAYKNGMSAVVSIDSANTNVTVNEVITIPSAVANWDKANVFAYFYTGSSGSNTQKGYIKDLKLERMSGANLIVDGAITTDKLLASAVTADKIAVNSVTANKIVIGDYNNYITQNENRPQSVTVGGLSIVDGWLYKTTPTTSNAWLSAVQANWTTEGEEYRVTGTVKAPKAGRVYFSILGRDAEGASKGSCSTPAITIAANTETVFDEVITITSAVSSRPLANVVVGFYDGATGNTYQDGYMKNLKCVRKTGEELIVNGAITAEKLNATNINASKILTVGAMTDAAQQSILNSNLSAVYKGYSPTGGNDAAKKATVNGFTLTSGNMATIQFGASQWTAAELTLNINETGAKPIQINEEAVSATNALYWHVNASITFRYTGSAYLVVDNPPSYMGGTCTIAEGTNNKVTVISPAVVYRGVTITVPMTNSNTASAPKLLVQNANGTNIGTSNIYFGSGTTVPTKTNGYAWPAGAAVIFTFDGQYWRFGNQTFIDGGNIITGKISADRIKTEDITVGSLSGGQNLVTDVENTKRFAKYTQSGDSATVTAKPWFKLASINMNVNSNQAFVKFSVLHGYTSSNTPYGSLSAYLRTDGNGYIVPDQSNLVWTDASEIIKSRLSNYVLAYQTNTKPFTAEIWVRVPTQWETVIFKSVSEGYGTTIDYSKWTLYQNETADAKASYTSGYTTKASTLDASSQYITNISGTGIRVHPSSTENNSVLINTNGMTVYKGGITDAYSVAYYGDYARIGKTGQKNIQITSTSLNVYDDDGTIPFQVSTANSSSSQAYSIAWYIKASSSYSTSAYFKGTIVDNKISVGVATSGVPTASNTVTLTNAGTEYTITVSGVKYTFTRYTGFLSYKIENTNTAKRSCLVSFTQSYKETLVKENTHILATRYQTVSIEDITGTCYSSTLYAYAGVAQLTLRVYHGSSSVLNGGLIYKGRLGGFAPIYECYMVGHINGVYAVSGMINAQGEIFIYNTSGGSRTVSSSNYASLSATYLLAQ